MYQYNKIAWGKTVEFAHIAELVEKHLGPDEPFLQSLGDHFAEKTAKAMDLVALRPKEENKLNKDERTALKQEQLARGTSRAYTVVTPDCRSLQVRKHPNFVKITRDADGNITASPIPPPPGFSGSSSSSSAAPVPQNAENADLEGMD